MAKSSAAQQIPGMIANFNQVTHEEMLTHHEEKWQHHQIKGQGDEGLDDALYVRKMPIILSP